MPVDYRETGRKSDPVLNAGSVTVTGHGVNQLGARLDEKPFPT
jgi:hypothetical protein